MCVYGGEMDDMWVRVHVPKGVWGCMYVHEVVEVHGCVGLYVCV